MLAADVELVPQQHPTEAVMDKLIPLVIPDTTRFKISDGLKILAASSPAEVDGISAAAIGTSVPRQPTIQRRKPADDIMSYAYPKYSSHPDTAAHVKQFQSIWAMNAGIESIGVGAIDDRRVLAALGGTGCTLVRPTRYQHFRNVLGTSG
jgi:hypothetical protein